MQVNFLPVNLSAGVILCLFVLCLLIDGISALQTVICLLNRFSIWLRVWLDHSEISTIADCTCRCPTASNCKSTRNGEVSMKYQAFYCFSECKLWYWKCHGHETSTYKMQNCLVWFMAVLFLSGCRHKWWCSWCWWCVSRCVLLISLDTFSCVFLGNMWICSSYWATLQFGINFLCWFFQSGCNYFEVNFFQESECTGCCRRPGPPRDPAEWWDCWG